MEVVPGFLISFDEELPSLGQHIPHREEVSAPTADNEVGDCPSHQKGVGESRLPFLRMGRRQVRGATYWSRN